MAKSDEAQLVRVVLALTRGGREGRGERGDGMVSWRLVKAVEHNMTFRSHDAAHPAGLPCVLSDGEPQPCPAYLLRSTVR